MDTARLTFDAHDEEGRQVVGAFGEIDAHTAKDLDASIRAAADLGPVVLDMAGVEFIDSAGLGVIVTLHNELEAADGLVLRNLPPRVAQVIDYAGLSEHLTIDS